MHDELLFVVIDNELTMRRIIAHFLREMAKDNPLLAKMQCIQASSAAEALKLFDRLFKRPPLAGTTYTEEPVVCMPGRQKKTIVICSLEMEEMDGLGLLRACMADDVFRDMSFVAISHKPQIECVSELGELGVTHILVSPLTFEKVSHTVIELATIVLSPEHGYFKAAEHLIDLGEYTSALNLIDKVKPQIYSSLKWLLLRGRAYLGTNDTERALGDFKAAEMGAHVASVIALKNLAEAYESVGDTAKTIDTLEKLVQKLPSNGELRLKLAELLLQDGQKDAVHEVIHPLVKEKHITQDIKIRIADLLDLAGFPEDAVAIKVQIVEGNLEDYTLCNEIAIALRMNGRFAAAEDCYRKIIKAYPTEPVVWFNRGVNSVTWARSEAMPHLLREALDYFRMTLKLDPAFPDAQEAIEKLRSEIRSHSRSS